MEASPGIPTLSLQPNTETIKRRLIRKGVFPTQKIVHTLRKKEIQKSLRKSKKIAEKSPAKPLSELQKQILAEEAEFQAITEEYRAIGEELNVGIEGGDGRAETMKMVGKPWEGLGRVQLRELSTNGTEYLGETKLKGEHLVELSEILLERNRDGHRWLLDDDIEEGEWMENRGQKQFTPRKRGVGDGSAIRFIVRRLSDKDTSSRDWKFARLMKQSEIQFTERNLMKIVGDLGALGSWRQAMSVVEWVYGRDEYKHRKSRFVYTKLLAVLGKARRSSEAHHIFNLMQEDCHIYPDIAAYHSIAVTLGQAGLVRELMTIIESMKKKPSKKIKNMLRRDWDPCIEPDVVVFNAWKGVSWVFQQMRKSFLKPNGATFGLAMEVMLQSGKYDLVHMFFEKMRRSGIAPTALTYKVLVRSFWKEGKMDEAVEAVRDMERRGVVGTASVYYEIACCLCKDGRWQKALAEVLLG
ncbi:hypothetical protein Syun_014600 [Stephania yunnanensis]|uniref:Pentatricopeptide repeat-containing protein n=1 Tax=Stephania yunnanensis TaxID=152371 RepID=A0AAP0JLT4_9MAGN